MGRFSVEACQRTECSDKIYGAACRKGETIEQDGVIYEPQMVSLVTGKKRSKSDVLYQTAVRWIPL